MTHPPADGAHPTRPLADQATERLFEFNSPSWIERARRATAETPLGRLGPYQLLAELGRGGQGEVYRAVQPGTGRLIALKRIAGLGLAPSDALRQRFAREVEALTRLSHPNVVTVHAAEVIEGHTVLVMELVEGRPIDQWADARWAEHAGALHTVLAAFAEACDGVAHAHSRGVIHRDLKPSNVLVNAAGRAKVLDFGIAKVLDEHQQQQPTVSGFFGTPGYAAPERTRAGAAEADTRSDVYSLGVLLFRVLAGREAFDGRAGVAPGQWESVPAPSRFRPLPRECDWIVEKAASVEPARRYQTVEALARDVRAVISGDPVEAAPPSTTYRLRKAVSRYRYAAAGAAIVAIAMIAATAVSLVAAERARAALARETEALEASRAAEQKALIEARRQEQVSYLMQQVLGASGAVGGGRPDITVREALDRAVAANFPDGGGRNTTLDPRVEAVLRGAIGDTYLGIGRYDEAVTHLSAADELYSQTERAGDHEHLRLMYLLGRTLRSQGRMDDAEKMLRRVVERYRATGHGETMAAADALSSLGVCLRWLNRLPEAEACYREALALYEKGQGPDGTGVSTMSMNIAILLSRRGDHAEAIAMGRKAISARNTQYPRAHPDKSSAYAIFANVLWAAGEAEEGERFFRESIAMDREMSPTPTAALATKLHELAGRLDGAGRLEEAVETEREAARIAASVSGTTHSSSIAAHTRLASYLRRLGRLDEALETCNSIDAAETPASADGVWLMAERGAVCEALGRIDEAESAFRRAWELVPDPLPSNSPALREDLARRIAEFYARHADLAAASDPAAPWRAAIRPAPSPSP